MAKFKHFLSTHWDVVILVIFMSVYAAVFSHLTILRHNSFASNYDLANMDQTIWNTLHGQFFSLSGVTGLVSRLSIHSNFTLVLISPLYLIWDDVRALLIFQSVYLALGAIPTYLLARKILKSKLVSLVIAAVYLLNPGMQWTNFYGFHSVSMAIPLLLSTFYTAYIKNWKWFWLFAFLAIITKEEISLYLVMLGLFMTFFFHERKRGLLLFFTGLLWFVTMVFVVIPYFSPNHTHWAFSWYQFSDEPTTGSEYFTSLEQLILKFIAPDIIHDYYFLLLKPFAFLPLLGLPWLLLSLPELAINVLSSQGQMHSIYFHYDSGVTPSLVIATIFGLSYVRRFSTAGLYLLAAGLLIFAIRVNYHYSPLPTTPSCWCLTYQVSDDDRQFATVLKTLPPSASITASGNVRPHLTHRKNAFILPNALETADYVAILTQERIVGNYRPIDTQFVEQLSASPHHELVSHLGLFYLFKNLSPLSSRP